MSNHVQTSNGHLSNIKTGIDSLLNDSNGIATHALLESSIGHINNMADIGSGSNQLRACALAVMPSGNGRILSCDVDGKLNVNADVVVADQDLVARTDIADVATRKNLLCSSTGRLEVGLDLYAGGGNNNIGEGSTKLQIFNYGRDVANGTYRPMVVNASAEQIIALSSTDKAVLDAIDTNTDNIDAKLDHLSTDLDTLHSDLGNIDTGIDAIEACVGSTGSAGATKCLSVGGTQSDGTQRELLTDTQGHLQVDVLNHPSNITGFALESTLGFAEAHLGNIDIGIDAIEACVGSTGSAGATKCLSVGGTQSDGTQRELLSDAQGHLQVDVLNHPSNITGFALESTLSDAETHLGHIDDGVDVLEACVASNKVNVNVSSGQITGFATESTVNAIKTAVELIDNCVDTAHLNVNMNIAGGDVTSSSGNLSAKTQRICLATDDIPIALVNTKLDTLETTLTEIETAVQLLDNAVDGAYLNVNMNIAGADVAASNGVLTAKTQRICLATDDVPTALVNTNLVALEATLETIKVDTEAIETAVELVSGCVTSSVLAVSGGGNNAKFTIATGSSELTDEEIVGPIDCSAISEICVIYPTSQTNNQLRLFVKGSATSGGSYFTFAQMTRKEFVSTTAGGGTTNHIWGTGEEQNNASFVPCMYDFIKIENDSGANFADSDSIRIVGR